ncbi:hypothetical protein EBT16_11630, partial [bacterium]|nr:hypothetical protein [bacterium]
IVNLSDQYNKSCAAGKCGGWKFISPNCQIRNPNCKGESGAWLAASEVCRLGLFVPRKKTNDPIGCCISQDGQFNPSKKSNCLGAKNTNGTNEWSSNICPQEGSPEYFILSNLEEFRENSLDAELIDLVFNQGVEVNVVDLDGSELGVVKLTGGEEFSLTINLNRKFRSVDAVNFSVPEDIGLYVYAESIDGNPVGDMVSATKVPEQNSILVVLNPSFVPSGSSEFSFQLNIEHPDFNTVRTSFIFRNSQTYEYTISLTGRTINLPGRLTPEYIEYLQGWISSFWAAYDTGNAGQIPPLTHPDSSANTEFYPFSHALWAVSQSHGNLKTDAQTVWTPGNRDLIEPWNFLGVSPNIYKCIMDSGLYERDVQVVEENGFSDWLFGTSRRTIDKGFDCRSFTFAAMKFLREQLASTCPSAKVMHQLVYKRHPPHHAMIYVDLGGVCADGQECDCCTGTFLYEPQTGGTWDNFTDYCVDNPGCWLSPDGGQQENIFDSPGFFDPNWEKYPEKII